MGVVSAIRSLLAESARKVGFTSAFNTEGQPRHLAPDVELGAFLIAQEAIKILCATSGQNGYRQILFLLIRIDP